MPSSSVHEHHEDDISATRGLDRIGRVGSRRVGYSVHQVRQVLDRCEHDTDRLGEDPSVETISSADIRGMVFDTEKGGYDPSDVDAVLESFEDRFAAAEKRTIIRTQGEEAHHEYAENLADLVMGRLKRQDGERFRRPARRRVEGYFQGDVDRLCEELLDYFRRAEQVEPTLIRRASFRAATSKHAYDEAQVDAFLEKTVQLIHALR